MTDIEKNKGNPVIHENLTESDFIYIPNDSAIRENELNEMNISSVLESLSILNVIKVDNFQSENPKFKFKGSDVFVSEGKISYNDILYGTIDFIKTIHESISSQVSLRNFILNIINTWSEHSF